MSKSQNRRAFLTTAGITVASAVMPRLAAQPKGVPQFPGTRAGSLDGMWAYLQQFRVAEGG
jgi:hypothetical protein